MTKKAYRKTKVGLFNSIVSVFITSLGIGRHHRNEFVTVHKWIFKAIGIIAADREQGSKMEEEPNQQYLCGVHTHTMHGYNFRLLNSTQSLNNNSFLCEFIFLHHFIASEYIQNITDIHFNSAIVMIYFLLVLLFVLFWFWFFFFLVCHTKCNTKEAEMTQEWLQRMRLYTFL